MEFPVTAAELEVEQRTLAAAEPSPFVMPAALSVAGVFVCFGRGAKGPGAHGDRGWAGAVVMDGRRLVESATRVGHAGGAYAPGLLALREGGLLAETVVALTAGFDVLLVDATGRDHPRRAGLALQLGAVLDVATVGVTHRPLLATGDWPPGLERGERAPLHLAEEVVGYWVRTRSGCRPLAVHAGWRTDPVTAVETVLRCDGWARTPEPLRRARRLARTMRAQAAGGAGSVGHRPPPNGP